MNDLLFKYRLGCTRSISQVSLEYYYSNHPKYLPVIDVKYNGTDILKFYSDGKLEICDGKFKEFVDKNACDIRYFIRYVLNLKGDINDIDLVDWKLFSLFIHCKNLLLCVNRKFG